MTEEVHVFFLRWHEHIEREHIRAMSSDIDKIAVEEGEFVTIKVQRDRSSINVFEFYAVMYTLLSMQSYCKDRSFTHGVIIHPQYGGSIN